MVKSLRILIVEDSEDDALLMIRQMKKSGYEPDCLRVETARAMRTALSEKTWDIILCDYKMPKFTGLSAISLLKESGRDIPFIIVSGVIGEETAADCMRLGAHDFIMKGNLSRLVPAIEREVKEAETRSKRKEAEKRLIESEKKFYEVFQNSPVPMAIGSLNEGRFLDVNDQYLHITEFPRDELIGHTVSELHLWVDYEDYDKIVNTLLQSQERIAAYPTSIRTKSGNIKDVLFSADVTQIQNTPYLLSSAVDITERKRTEAALSESEARYRTLFEDASDGMAIADIETGTLVDCNRALCRLVERGKEEILGQPQSFLHLPEDLVNGQSPSYQKHRMIRYEAALEDRLFSKSGKIVPVEIRGTRIRINGRDHVMGVFRDITERMQSEEMLRQSEHKFRDLADLLPQVVFELDLQGRLTYVNRFAFDLFGYSKTDLEEGLDALDMIAPCDRDRAAANMSKAMREGIQTGIDYTAVRRNGEEFPVIIYSTPIHSNGNIIGLRGIIVDFTERKRSLERIQKALEATIHAIAITVETRDPYTAGHQRRVADLSRAIAAEMGLTDSQIDSLYMAGIIHDLGKISIPSEILSKPARLADIEFELIKVHPQSGYDILKDIEFPWPVARIIIEHHERMNGSGYPHRLTGDRLLIESRILAVADVVESMASHRPYRPALGLDAAFEEISKNKGILYDPEAVDACIRLFAEKNYKMID